MGAINERLQILVDKYADGNKSRFGRLIGGVRDTTIHTWINTERSIPSDTLETICRNLNVSAEWMLLGEGEMEKQEPTENQTVKEVLAMIAQIKEQLEAILKENKRLTESNQKLKRIILEELGES